MKNNKVESQTQKISVLIKPKKIISQNGNMKVSKPIQTEIEYVSGGKNDVFNSEIRDMLVNRFLRVLS